MPLYKPWRDISRLIADCIDLEFSLLGENVLFSVHENKSEKSKELYIINLPIILAKFHTHKSKFSNSKPRFIMFENDTKQYSKTIFDTKNKKAEETINLCSHFNVFNVSINLGGTQVWVISTSCQFLRHSD